jgi:hypothetical protein
MCDRNRFKSLLVILLVGLTFYSCLDQDIDQLTAAQTQRLLVGELGTKVWLVGGENLEITFSALGTPTSATIRGNDDAVFVSSAFRLSQNSRGVFTDTLYFESLSSTSNAVVSGANLVQRITSLEIQLVNDTGLQIKLVKK